MRELFWGIVALAGLSNLVLIALGLRFQSLNKTSLGVSNIFADGLLVAIFALLFAPIYLAWMGIQSIWFRLHGLPAVPSESDDAFLARK